MWGRGKTANRIDAAGLHIRAVCSIENQQLLGGMLGDPWTIKLTLVNEQHGGP